MVSIKSIMYFFSINTLLTSFGFIQHILIENQPCVYRWLPTAYLTFVIRNYALMTMIDYCVKHKPLIKNHLTLKETYKHEFDVNVLSSTLIETLTYIIVRTYILNNDYNTISLDDILCFIPLSFIFELVFDFFHYWTHRMVHHPLLYAYIHKKHHKHLHPITITTYYQDPLDIMITNSLPIILTLLLFPLFSLPQFHTLLVYKNYIEISGHCGRHLAPSNSFTQCIWLPRLFNIQLYTEEHDMHHSINKCNFSKRFSLWDKIFGTFRAKKI